MTPKVVDNDRDEITAELNGTEIRGWSYRDEAERRVKMLAAREFCEGWFQADKANSRLLESIADTAQGYWDEWVAHGYEATQPIDVMQRIVALAKEKSL